MPVTLLSSGLSHHSFYSAVSAFPLIAPAHAISLCYAVDVKKRRIDNKDGISLDICFRLSSQGHLEGWCDVSGPSKEDPQQRPDDAGTDEPDPVGGGLTPPRRSGEGKRRRLGCRALGVEDGVDFFFSFFFFPPALQFVWSLHRTTIHPLFPCPLPSLLLLLLSPRPDLSLHPRGSAVGRNRSPCDGVHS